MGGLAGHMMHLYDDESMTFGELETLSDSLLLGDISKKSVTEKTDGQNLFVSFDGTKFVAARNITQIREGGVSLKTLSTMWPDKPNVQAAFCEGFGAFMEVAKNISTGDLRRVFFDGQYWINMEILYPENSNTLAYDRKAIQFHGIQKWDPASKKLIPAKVSPYKKFKRDTVTGIRNENEWSVLGPIHVKLSNNSDAIEESISRLEEIMTQVNMKAENTIGDYTKKRLEIILKEFGVIASSDVDELTTRTFQAKNPLKRHKDTYPGLTGYTAAKLRRMAIEPLEDFVGFVSYAVLRNLNSALMDECDQKAKTMDQTVRSIVSSVKNKLGENHEDSIWLESELEKISRHTSFYAQNLEGLVIEAGDKLYKLTGFFAPINQILGAVKFGKIKLEHSNPIPKNLLEGGGKKIAIFPGAFKPPHIGHFSMVRDALRHADVVYVVASNKSRDGVSSEVTKHVWKKFYFPVLGGNVKLIMAPSSPIKSTFDVLKDLDGSITLYAGKEDAARFKDVGKYARPGSTIKVKNLSRSITPASATKFRSAIRTGDKSVLGFIPREVKKKKELVDYLVNNI